MVGPCDSGKSVIANSLAEATDLTGGNYRPTKGVRILEFECNGLRNSSNRTLKADVELWDCSGNSDYESCWPAMWKDTHGVIIVYNPDNLDHNGEISKWYTHFISQQGLRDSQCMLFAHLKPDGSKQVVDLTGSLSRLKCVHTSMEDRPEVIRQEFRTFLTHVWEAWAAKRDQEELSIVNN
ncbi:uncharacterized protein TRIADDRAFT_59732 [Trichoplax adhaerens]|uniref:Intraflagellar transport protein 22 homolog n=1 Tax=Trichoplax adhaerens TaxID=10228 RepID=B3S6A1_TRIAD|nr:hypothetical protein TRIADDRAFT_59732 [Trichoplax adhaerens]EDV21587.1 hypothetical protein TRIADDRAFT_59732 [Trichoplax adhaerens]|eukprot:XP_002115735.1 hypothetical protein TRIADDRAFT_59732 [Trichoplax adhaerens]